MNTKKASRELFWMEQELIKRCGLTKERFHKARSDQWKNIYYIITEKYADKTKTWKNGLHWANTNGYSPKSMKHLLGCYPVDYATWFHSLPQIISDDAMVYFLIDKGGFLENQFWIFESGISELIQVLDVCNQTAFLEMGWLDYYIVSKKFQWLIGFNHHDIVSCVGEGLNLATFRL